MDECGGGLGDPKVRGPIGRSSGSAEDEIVEPRLARNAARDRTRQPISRRRRRQEHRGDRAISAASRRRVQGEVKVGGRYAGGAWKRVGGGAEATGPGV